MALWVMPSNSASAVADVACDMASLVFMTRNFSTLKEFGTRPISPLKYLGGLIPAMTLAERIAEAIGDRPQAEIARAVKKSEVVKLRQSSRPVDPGFFTSHPKYFSALKGLCFSLLYFLA